jgi:hypothetical protein
MVQLRKTLLLPVDDLLSVTSGMSERFNGRITDVPKTQRFNSQEDLA